jgi:hypothetical protein
VNFPLLWKNTDFLPTHGKFLRAGERTAKFVSRYPASCDPAKRMPLFSFYVRTPTSTSDGRVICKVVHITCASSYQVFV